MTYSLCNFHVFPRDYMQGILDNRESFLFAGIHKELRQLSKFHYSELTLVFPVEFCKEYKLSTSAVKS